MASKFELAAQNLGFNDCREISYPNKKRTTVTKQEQQEALLKIFYLSGYFAPQKLWEDILCFAKANNPEKIFRSVYSVLNKARAFQKDLKRFDAAFLRKNLFETTFLDIQDVMDYLLYVAQNSFSRKLGQERNELTKQDWMTQHLDDYIASARCLGLVEREFSKQLEYDEAWIAGASRLSLLTRIIDYKYLLLQGIKIKGLTLVLAGERPLWANLDGIDPMIYKKILVASRTDMDLSGLDAFIPIDQSTLRLEEGKKYIQNLAQRYCVRLDRSAPCIQYMVEEECPKGFFPGRLYANYATDRERKLTETMMAEDLTRSFLVNIPVQIIDTTAQTHQRPTTASTAYDAATYFVNKIISGALGSKKKFIILLQTNNPHIERQTLSAQQQVNKVLENSKLGTKGYKITIQGVGLGCKHDITAIHSEFAALLAEKWKCACKVSKRDITELLFQTRPQPSSISDFPVIN